jgi:hypothetical protein
LRMKLASLVTGIALLFGTLSAPAFASSSNISLTDITDHTVNSSITIQGSSTFSDVIVKIIAPNNTLYYYDNLTVVGGKYSKTIMLSSGALLGLYKVVTGNGTDVATDTFTVYSENNGGGGGGSGGGGSGGGGSGGSSGGGSGGGGSPSNTTPDITNDTSINSVVGQGQKAVPIASSTKTDGNTVIVIVSDSDLNAALDSASNSPVAVVIKIAVTETQKAQVNMTASQIGILANSNAGNSLIVSIGISSLALPVSVFKGLPVGATLQIVLGSAADQTSMFTNQRSDATIIGNSFSYDVNVVTNAGTKPIDVSAKDYIKRSFAIKGFDTTSAGVLYIENGRVYAVPAVYTANTDGTVTVAVNRPGLSVYAAATHKVNFTDIGTSWAKTQIESLARKFLLNGTSDSLYSPKDSVTRAQFSAMLVRALGLHTSAAAPFKDVKSSDWSAGEVAAAYEAGLVNGVSNDQFAPDSTISRQDMSVMLSRAMILLQIKKKSAPPHVPYTDSSNFSSYAASSIQSVTDSGIMSGDDSYGSPAFHPTDDTTREAAAMVLYNLLQAAKLIN